MILEGNHEINAARQYKRCKTREKNCREKLGNAIKDNEFAWESGDSADMESAGQKLDQALENHKKAEKEMEHAIKVLADFALQALCEQNIALGGKTCRI